MTIGFLLVMTLMYGDTRPRVFVDQRGEDAVGRAFSVAVRARVAQHGTYRLAATRADADLIMQIQTMAVPCEPTTSIIGAQFLRPGASLVFVGSLLERVPMVNVTAAADIAVREFATMAR